MAKKRGRNISETVNLIEEMWFANDFKDSKKIDKLNLLFSNLFIDDLITLKSDMIEIGAIKASQGFCTKKEAYIVFLIDLHATIKNISLEYTLQYLKMVEHNKPENIYKNIWRTL